MALTTANRVADFLISFSSKHGDPLTNLKLQKLVYYAQAWHLALYDKPLFRDPIEAWTHGPVVRSVYNRFKVYGPNPIDCVVDEPDIPNNLKEHMKEILNAYGHLSAFQLEQIAHSELPWRKARGNLAPDDPSAEQISIEDMREFFKKKLNE
ncbi:MAG: type II toxin-antitoxin system antitoxin SocA domain-containing protein [bacterium]